MKTIKLVYTNIGGWFKFRYFINNKKIIVELPDGGVFYVPDENIIAILKW